MIKKVDFHCRISQEFAAQIKKFGVERGMSRNLVVLSAIERFMDESAAEARPDSLESLRKEVFEIKRRIGDLREEVEILGELLSFYVYHWIGYTPRLDREERLSLAAEAKERHERFLTLFAQKLALGDLSLRSLYKRTAQLRQEATATAEGANVQATGTQELEDGQK